MPSPVGRSYATLLVILPLLAGLFWGAPAVARETEAGTHHLAWTQGVTRRRWALVKFGLITLTALIAAIAYAVLMTWWAKPLTSTSGGRFAFIIFDLQGVAPIGYTLFAVALGVFAGAATRKVLPAMAATLVGFVAVRMVVMFAARPVFLSPKERTFPVATTEIPNPASGDWLLSHAIVDPVRGTFNGGYAYCEPSVTCPDEGSYNLLTLPARRTVLVVPVRRDRDLPGTRGHTAAPRRQAGSPQDHLSASDRSDTADSDKAPSAKFPSMRAWRYAPKSSRSVGSTGRTTR